MFESLSEVMNWKPPLLQSIIGGGILPVGCKLMLVGAEGTMKTMLTTHMSFCVASGEPWLGFETEKCKTGILQCELPKALYKERIEQAVNASTNGRRKTEIMFATDQEIKLSKPMGYGQLAADINKNALKLVAVDPVYKVVRNALDWVEVSQFMDNLDSIIRLYHCSIWLVHHRRKVQIADGKPIDLGTDEAIGLSLLKDWVDTMLRILPVPSEPDNFILQFLKTRYAKVNIQPMKIHFNRKDLSFELASFEIAADELKDIEDYDS